MHLATLSRQTVVRTLIRAGIIAACAALATGLTSCTELSGALDAYGQAYEEAQGAEQYPQAPPETAPIPLERESAMRECGFSEESLAWIEQNTGSVLQPFRDGDGRLRGVLVALVEADATALLEHLETSAPEGCVAFRSEANYGYGPDKVVFIKTADQYDILRVSQTSGIVYSADGSSTQDITTEMVVAQLKEWDRQYGLTITGAGYNWVEARMATPPERLYSFAHDVYEFSPDVVDYWMGSVQALANDMNATSTLYLWWD